MTAPQVRMVLAKLLQDPPRSLDDIAREATQQLSRTGEARRHRWRAKGLVAPPRPIIQ